MSRTGARVTQADINRCIRAAKQAGAGAVVVQPDGSIKISLVPEDGENAPKALEQKRVIVL